MQISLNLAGALCALVLAATPALGGAKQDKLPSARDGEWITLSGTVKTVAAHHFTLKHGSGQIVVEMDDYDSYNENVVRVGDRVTVTGRIDQDFFEKKKIEASSVYLPKLKRYFYASADDEEWGYYAYPVARYDWKAADDEWIVVTGTVTSINGDEMVVDTGLGTFEVDTDDVTDSPVANWLKVGDRVSVAGELDDADLFDDREIEASSIVILVRQGPAQRN